MTLYGSAPPQSDSQTSGSSFLPNPSSGRRRQWQGLAQPGLHCTPIDTFTSRRAQSASIPCAHQQEGVQLTPAPPAWRWVHAGLPMRHARASRFIHVHDLLVTRGLRRHALSARCSGCCICCSQSCSLCPRLQIVPSSALSSFVCWFEIARPPLFSPSLSTIGPCVAGRYAHMDAGTASCSVHVVLQHFPCSMRPQGPHDPCAPPAPRAMRQGGVWLTCCMAGL